MKKSISYWAFPGGLEGTISLRDCFLKAKELGFDAVEVAMNMEGEINLESSEDDIRKIVKTAEESGLKFQVLQLVCSGNTTMLTMTLPRLRWLIKLP